jgi:hypothetical protein
MMGDESSIFHYGLDVEICICIFGNLCRKKQFPGKYFVFYSFVLKVTLSGNMRLRDGHVLNQEKIMKSIGMTL